MTRGARRCPLLCNAVGLTTTEGNGGGTSGAPRALPARVHRAPKLDRARGHQTSPRERTAIVAIAVTAAVVGAFSAGEPTLFWVTNVVLRGATAAVLTLATSRARRWTWLVLAGLAAVGAPAGLWLAVCAAGLLFAFVTTLFPRRRLFGAIVGATAAQGILRYTVVGSGRYSIVLVLVAVLPVLCSAYAVAPRRVRRRIHWVLVAGMAGAFVGALLFGIVIARAYSSTQSASRASQSGLAAVRDGHSEVAAGDLHEAASSFRTAHAVIDAWWARPIGAVPGLAPQLHAMEVVTAEGASVADAAAGTAEQADIQQLRYTDGHIDVKRLRALQAPLRDTAVAFEQASARVADVRSSWLVGPLADRVGDVDRELRESLPEIQLASDAAASGPDLLGASGTRRYLVLFTQPSESRGLGGFVGNWAEITATDGSLSISASGRVADLNETPGRDTRAVTAPPAPADYVERYSRFRPGYFFQDLTLSPDLPSVAAAAAQIYPQTGHGPVDGVMAVDPYALAALLQFTGSVKVEGLDQPLTADNAVQLLVKDQYLTDATNGERKDLLEAASRATFDKLVHGSLPSPKKVAEVLGPIAAQHRLAFVPTRPSEKALLTRLGADGAFPAPGPDDFLSVVTQNNANNKIDMFLHRQIDYDAHYDPGTGDVEATATVTLRNDAPAAGLPPSIIGSNDQGLPPGTNRAYFSLYTPLGLRGAKVRDVATPLEFQHELGFSVYSAYVEIPAGQSVTIEVSLFGHLESGATYRLQVANQPLVNPDEVRVHVRPASDWEIVASDTLHVESGGSSAAVVGQPTGLQHLDAEMARP